MCNLICPCSPEKSKSTQRLSNSPTICNRTRFSLSFQSDFFFRLFNTHRKCRQRRVGKVGENETCPRFLCITYTLFHSFLCFMAQRSKIFNYKIDHEHSLFFTKSRERLRERTANKLWIVTSRRKWKFRTIFITVGLFEFHRVYASWLTLLEETHYGKFKFIHIFWSFWYSYCPLWSSAESAAPTNWGDEISVAIKK